MERNGTSSAELGTVNETKREKFRREYESESKIT